MSLEILKIDQDALTGHVTAHVRVVEVVNNQVSYGPLETVGIDHGSLSNKYGLGQPGGMNSTQADVEAAFERWLADHHKGALARKQAMDQRSAVVNRLAGRTLTFEKVL